MWGLIFICECLYGLNSSSCTSPSGRSNQVKPLLVVGYIPGHRYVQQSAIAFSKGRRFLHRFNTSQKAICFLGPLGDWTCYTGLWISLTRDHLSFWPRCRVWVACFNYQSWQFFFFFFCASRFISHVLQHSSPFLVSFISHQNSNFFLKIVNIRISFISHLILFCICEYRFMHFTPFSILHMWTSLFHSFHTSFYFVHVKIDVSFISYTSFYFVPLRPMFHSFHAQFYFVTVYIHVSFNSCLILFCVCEYPCFIHFTPHYILNMWTSMFHSFHTSFCFVPVNTHVSFISHLILYCTCEKPCFSNFTLHLILYLSTSLFIHFTPHSILYVWTSI